MSCAGYALTATLVRTRCRGPANAHASPMRLAWRAGNYRARVPARKSNASFVVHTFRTGGYALPQTSAAKCQPQ